MPALPRFVARRAPGQIRGYKQAVARLASPTEIRDCVSAVTIGHLDPFGGAATIKSKDTVRLDRQPNGGGGANAAANLQIQVNAAAGVQAGQGTTIGQVLVPAATFLVANTHAQAVNLRRQLENVVRGALNQSAFGSGGAWFIIDAQ